MVELKQDSHGGKIGLKDEKITECRLKTRFRKDIYEHLVQSTSWIKKQFVNSRWQASLDSLQIAILMFISTVVMSHPLTYCISDYHRLFGSYLQFDYLHPAIVRISVISFLSSFLYLIWMRHLRQYLLRILLSYKGWLYQPPRSQNLIVIVWALLLRFLSPRKPKFYSYQGSLPRMPVPPLQTTVKKLLQSLKPELDKGEYEKMELDANEFLSTIGPKLQWILYLKSWWSPNYYTDWWEKYVYLMSRDPIAINSNYCFHDQMKWIPTNRQTSRAAGVTSLILKFKSLLDSEELDPVLIRDTIPLCNWQYERMFSTARIPRTDGDIISHHPTSKHIAVYAKGHFYKVNVEDSHGKPLNLLDFESLFDWILQDAETWPDTRDAKTRIASLTSNDRTTWASYRREHFTSGVNRDSIRAIEEAIFLTVLDDNKFTDINERVKHLLHGNGSSLWFDKSFCMVFFKDGKMGINAEHSWGDGTPIGHLMEYVLIQEFLYRLYDDKGLCKPYISPHTSSLVPSRETITPTRLHWDMNFALEKIINESYLFATKNNADLDICMKIHDAYGKGVMKRARINPDAFLQMALQLAYHKDSGGLFASTYEASITRLFLHGRTETVRSLTQEVQEFVLAMNDSTTTATEKMRLMRTASEKHQKIFRDCMSGRGVDRHLFALYVVGKAKKYNCSFLEKVLKMPWVLSTTQGPLFQLNHGLNPNNNQVMDAYSPGGAFGPGSYDGYGVGYVLMGDSTISFNISSKVSCPTTDSTRFSDNIFSALFEMKRVIDETDGDRVGEKE